MSWSDLDRALCVLGSGRLAENKPKLVVASHDSSMYVPFIQGTAVWITCENTCSHSQWVLDTKAKGFNFTSNQYLLVRVER